MTDHQEQDDVQLSESAHSPSGQEEQAPAGQDADEQAEKGGQHGRPSDDSDPGHS